jgi:hypothetical protein
VSQLDLVGVADGPPEPLDEMSGEVLGLEVGQAHPFPEHDRLMLRLAGRISKHDYVRHRFLLVDVCFSSRVALPDDGAVNIS